MRTPLCALLSRMQTVRPLSPFGLVPSSLHKATANHLSGAMLDPPLSFPSHNLKQLAARTDRVAGPAIRRCH